MRGDCWGTWLIMLGFMDLGWQRVCRRPTSVLLNNQISYKILGIPTGIVIGCVKKACITNDLAKIRRLPAATNDHTQNQNVYRMFQIICQDDIVSACVVLWAWNTTGGVGIDICGVRCNNIWQPYFMHASQTGADQFWKTKEDNNLQTI